LTSRHYWRGLSYGSALVFAVTLGYFLLRVPIQTSDCFSNMLVLGDSFVDVMKRGIQPGYVRPGLWAQLKVVHDLSQGAFFYWFRWTQVVQVLCVLVSFTALVRPRTAPGAVVLPLALAVLIGHNVFAWTVREAFPVNAYLTNVICCGVAANLAFGVHRWWTDVAAVLLFVVSAASIESGLLVGGIFVVAYVLGLRGVSRIGLGAVVASIAGYFLLRFLVLDSGTPSFLDREAGFGFQRYSGADITRMFAGREFLFYGYNVLSSILGVLFSEPRDGAWRLTRSVLDGAPDARLVVGFLSSTAATALIGRYVWVRRDAWRRRELDRGDQIVVIFVLVLAANAALSFVYTKDAIMSPAGFFYAAAFFVACRHYLESLATRLGPAPRASRAHVFAVAFMLLLSTTWTIRAVGLHAGLTQTAYKNREQWAYFDEIVQRTFAPVPPSVEALKTLLQDEAVIVHPGKPELRERWTPLFEMD
jgi:hypothetical protein